jgi:hypothetical protein
VLRTRRGPRRWFPHLNELAILVQALDTEVPATRIPVATFFYWLITATLVVFGVLGIFSVGLPFLALGFALVVLFGARGLPYIFWPPIVGVVLFFATYILFAPLGCKTTPTVSQEVMPGDLGPTTSFSEQRITCDRLLLPDTVGTDNPPLWPAALAAVVVAFGGANITRLTILRRSRRGAEPEDETDAV